jgi:hypothetical protein
MNIRARFSISADGYVTTQDGWPSLVADPAFVSGQSHGFPEFQKPVPGGSVEIVYDIR